MTSVFAIDRSFKIAHMSSIANIRDLTYGFNWIIHVARNKATTSEGSFENVSRARSENCLPSPRKVPSPSAMPEATSAAILSADGVWLTDLARANFAHQPLCVFSYCVFSHVVTRRIDRVTGALPVTRTSTCR